MNNWDAIAAEAKILIVEDDPASARLLERLLKQAEYRNIVTTGRATEAARLFREVKPDLVLLDLHLPGADGLDLLREMSEPTRRLEYLPILVITGDANDAVRLQALVAGAKDFVTKPIDTVEVMLRIRILLETRFGFLELKREVAQVRAMLAEVDPPRA